MIASVSTSSKIVVEKSTVPVKTAEAIEKVRLVDALLAKLILSNVHQVLTSVVSDTGQWRNSRLCCATLAGAEEELRGPECTV